MSISILPARKPGPDKRVAQILAEDGEYLRTRFVPDVVCALDEPSVSPEGVRDLLDRYLIGIPDLPHEKATMDADVRASAEGLELRVENVFTFRMPTGKSKYVLDFFYIPLMNVADVPGVPIPSVSCDDGLLTFVYRTSRYAEDVDESLFDGDVAVLCDDHWARIQFAVELMKQDIEAVQKRDATLLGIVDVHKERWRRAKAAMEIAVRRTGGGGRDSRKRGASIENGHVS